MIVLAVFAANESPVVDDAQVVFPIPSYAEQEGHFTNVDGIVQKIEEAFEPRGESRPVVEIFDAIKKSLEKKSAVKRAS